MLILVVGMAIAVLIYVKTPDDSNGNLGQELSDSRRYGYELERIGGKAAILTVKFNQWFESLWHGTQLATTVAFLSIIIAIVCFVMAHVLSEELPRDDKLDNSG